MADLALDEDSEAIKSFAEPEDDLTAFEDVDFSAAGVEVDDFDVASVKLDETLSVDVDNDFTLDIFVLVVLDFDDEFENFTGTLVVELNNADGGLVEEFSNERDLVDGV